MADLRYGFDGAANDAAATAANTGLASINASGTAGSTLVHKTSGSADGAGHLLLTPVSGGVLQGIANMDAIKATMIKLKQDSAPVNTANIGQWRDAAGAIATLQILNTGKLKLADWTSTEALYAMPGWMRIVFWRAADGSSYKVGLFQGESTTPYEPIFTGGALGAGSSLVSYRFGRTTGASEVTPLRLDSVFLTDTATDIPTGPFNPPTPPTIIGSADTDDALIDFRNSTPSGLTWQAPGGVQTIMAGVYRVQRTNQDQTFEFVATNPANGLTASKTIVVPRLRAHVELLTSTGSAFV